MKKLLTILVLGLLLSGNAYAATKYTYLSCKTIIEKNESMFEGFSKNQEHLKIGSNNSHIFYKFKDNKKKSKVRIYVQGDYTQANWKTIKPAEFTINAKWTGFAKDKHLYLLSDKLTQGKNTISEDHIIQKVDDLYRGTVIFIWDQNKKNQINLVMDTECSIVDKSELKAFLKNGIKY